MQPPRISVAPIPPQIVAIERPRESLMTYYVLTAILSNVAFPFVFPYLYFRYHTMRYRFDIDGIHMKWGIIFRREVLLNYSRIQDIHLRSNLVERWLGLARIEIQTASGSASANMTLEGMEDPEGMRDFLYSRMRGTREEKDIDAADPVAAALLEIAGELREIRAVVEEAAHVTVTAWVKDAVLRLARVPADPHVPEGAEESVRVFNAGRNYFLWRMILWGLGNAVTALLLSVAFAFSFIPKLPPLVRAIWLAVEAGAVCIFVASIPITYFLQRLNYEMRWYIVTDRSLRIRSGVVWLQEITMTFANIQEIRVNANPVERLLGLANVEVSSAGGRATAQGEPSSGHVGKFAGVDNAEAIRDLLVERLRAYRDSGLGEKTVEAREPHSLTAAREVLQETKALRNSLVNRVVS